MKRKLFIPAAIAAAGLAAAGGLAYAQQGPFGEVNDAASNLAGVRVGLVQAIAAAEQHAGGRAARAEIENERGGAIFEVEVVTAANAVMDVKVDADGKVIAATQDTGDNGDEKEGEDGGKDRD